MAHRCRVRLQSSFGVWRSFNELGINRIPTSPHHSCSLSSSVCVSLCNLSPFQSQLASVITESHLKLNRRGILSQPGQRAECRLVTPARCCPVVLGQWQIHEMKRRVMHQGCLSVSTVCCWCTWLCVTVLLKMCVHLCVFASASIKRHVYMAASQAKWLWGGACCLQLSGRPGSQQPWVIQKWARESLKSFHKQ